MCAAVATERAAPAAALPTGGAKPELATATDRCDRFGRAVTPFGSADGALRVTDV
jgi:hypothetical protein